MKSKWGVAIIPVLAISAFLVNHFTVRAQTPPPRPRFEEIYHEDNGQGEDGPRVWHDKETGQEIVCFAGGGVQQNPSCWLTGRKW